MDDVEVVVGRIGKPHGLTGEVTVEVRTDEPERRFADGAVLRAEPPRGAPVTAPSLSVESTRWHQGRLLVRFEGLDDRDAAEAVRGTLLHAVLTAGDQPEDPEEYYHHQLVGLAVHDEHGTLLGEVSAMTLGAAQDLLTVRTTDGRDALVPFVAALVPEVDLETGRIVVADRPGLVAPYPED